MDKLEQKSDKLTVVINSPDRLIWEGKADSVSSENSDGAFDVLPEHAHFITIIEDKPIIVRSSNQEERYMYENAVLMVKEGVVTIYTDI
jgi:F0F1-type ATP synthase epsilon subunit